MKRKRVIYIAPELAKEACGSKESLDALALVLSIKTTFVDSVMRDGSTVNVMRTLRIGHARCQRAMGHALRAGWLVRAGGSLRAARIRNDNAHNVRLELDRCHYDGKREASAVVRAPYKLTELCDIIRQAILMFHISKQCYVYDTLTMATHPKRGQVRQMKRARKRSEGWGMCKQKLQRKGRRLSYARMSELAVCSSTKAKTLVKSMVCAGLVRKEENYKRTDISLRHYRNDRGAYLRALHFELGKPGCIVCHDGAVCIRFANSYTLRKPMVKYIYQGKTA